MKNQNPPVRKWLGKIVLFSAEILLWGILFSSFLWAQNTTQFENRLNLEFRKRLEQLVDDKTRDFFTDLNHKEKFLNLLIENTIEEVKRREKEGFRIDYSQYHLIFVQPDTLIKSYRRELQKIIRLWDRLETLEQLFTQYQVQQGVAEVESLKTHLLEIVDGNKAKQQYYSMQLAQQLLDEYSEELKKIVKVLTKLEQLKKQAQATGESTVGQEIATVKEQIAEVLAVEPEQIDPVEEEYFQEVIKVVLMLQELDEFKKRIAPQNIGLLRHITELKKKVLQCVDWDLLRALGYSNFETLPRPSRLVETIEEWKASQLLWYKATLKQAELLRANLIAGGSQLQTKRMLKADLEQAIQVYSEKDFPVAELLFENILKQYKTFGQFDDVKFYLAESCLAQNKYEKAQHYYLNITENYPGSEYAKYALLRLMLISQTFHRFDDVIEFFTSLSKMYVASAYDETFEKATYLVGYVYFSKGNYQQAISTFQTLPKKSKYFLPAAFLIATSEIALGHKDKAIPIYRYLSKEKNYPHKDALAEMLINNSLLKLGLLYYEKGDLVEGLRLFESISDKFDNYHVALIAKAWTEFRLGRLKSAVNDLDMLFWNYLDSNYLYEAMMLSAHCNRILGNIPESLRELRYVENAKKTFTLLNAYNDERKQIVNILHQLSTLEEKVLLQNDPYAYYEIRLLQDKLLLLMQTLDSHNLPGVHFVEEVNAEHTNILELIQKLQDYQRITETLGYNELRRNIVKTRNRLLHSLKILQKFKDIRQVDILADYPLAQKQSNLKYQQELLKNMAASIKKERQQIQQYRKELSQLIKLAQEQKNMDVLSKLEFQQEGLETLTQKLEAFMVFVSESKYADLDTDFEKWTNFSGFGMSDLDFMRMKAVENQIIAYNRNVETINNVLKYRQKQVLIQMEDLAEKEKQLQEQLRRQKIQQLRQKQKEYFLNEYFDTRTSEVERHSKKDSPDTK